MKKIFFTINQNKKIQLVKGCPTDINQDGHENDDYNHDGNTDQYDQAYYDGYINGYFDWDFDDLYNDDEGIWEMYQQGKDAGNDDVHNEIFNTNSDHTGPDIWYEDFTPAGAYSG